MKKSITIYTDGKTTTAVLKNGKDIIQKATAKCSDQYEFNFDYGARLAFERLLDQSTIGALHVSTNEFGGTVNAVNICDEDVEAIIKSLSEKIKPKYNAKLICIADNDAPDFRIGKIYEVKNGLLYGDECIFAKGMFGKCLFESLNEINDEMKSDFIELVE